jgi:hypothetical protein
MHFLSCRQDQDDALQQLATISNHIAVRHLFNNTADEKTVFAKLGK